MIMKPVDSGTRRIPKICLLLRRREEEEPARVDIEGPEVLIRRVTRRFSAKLIDFI